MSERSAALSFRCLGVPVRVEPGFWVLALVFGMLGSQSLVGALTWPLALGLSILVHELGHALVARRYGHKPVIVLRALGGVTSFTPTRSLSRAQQLRIALAGPFAGFLLAFCGLALLLRDGLEPVQAALESSPELSFTGFLALLVWMNLFYNAINLIPVLPFDGGKVLLLALGKGRERLAAMVSLGFGVAAVGLFVAWGWYLLALLFGFFTASGFFAARSSAEVPELPPHALKEILERAQELQNAGRYAECMALAMAVFQSTNEEQWKVRAVEAAAWAGVLAERPAEARAVLARLAAEQVADKLLLAAVAELERDYPKAQALLQALRDAGDVRPEVLGGLIRNCLKQGNHAEACALAGASVAELEPQEVRELGTVTVAAGVCGSGALLYEQLFRQTGSGEDALAAARAWLQEGAAEQARGVLGEAVNRASLAWSVVAQEPGLSALVPPTTQ